MISNEHSTAARGEYGGHRAPKQGVPEETLKTDRIQIERKAFLFALKENPRGRFLRITEDINGRRDSIIVPATGLEEFRKVVDDMLQVAAETPEKTE
ncbi:MAG: PUR family DNA/RNA-binding protein [Verrucomicrobia bacterium]|nr:PUR family DNA/RNA-binding protein [Verrucomicrobiota bacterium]